MTEIVAQVIQEYARIPPEDLRDTEMHMSAETAEQLAKEAGISPDLALREMHHATLFGLRVRRNDLLPFGIVQLVTENAQDRAIRRARRDGVIVNVIKPVDFLPPVIPPAPAPTLRALLKHWLRRAR